MTAFAQRPEVPLADIAWPDPHHGRTDDGYSVIVSRGTTFGLLIVRIDPPNGEGALYTSAPDLADAHRIAAHEVALHRAHGHA